MVPPPDPTYAGPGRTLPVGGSWGELKASSWDRGLFVGLSCVTSVWPVAAPLWASAKGKWKDDWEVVVWG